MKEQEVFHFKWRIHLQLLILILFLPSIYLSFTKEFYVHTSFYLFNVIFAGVLIRFVSIVSLTEEGLSIYRVNKLKWNDVKSAHKTSFLGLPYILIKRNKGFSWWLPLYYVGERNIQDALLNIVPDNNPIRNAISET